MLDLTIRRQRSAFYAIAFDIGGKMDTDPFILHDDFMKGAIAEVAKAVILETLLTQKLEVSIMQEV